MIDNPFIVLEGLSAVGKTTLAQNLALKLGGHYVKTPGKEYRAISDYIDKNVSTEARYLFYLSSIIESSRQISFLLKNAPVVCDRYIYTTICWHKALGVKINIGDSFFQENIIIKPNFSFLITCEEEKRIERMKKRGISHYDNFELISGVENNYLKNFMEFKMVMIDNTDDDGIDIVIKKMIALIA